MVQPVILARRQSLGHGRNALAITRPDQPRNIEGTHPPPCLMTQPFQKRLEPATKLPFPIGPLHRRPLHKPTTHESLKSRFVNPSPVLREEISAKVVLARADSDQTASYPASAR